MCVCVGGGGGDPTVSGGILIIKINVRRLHSDDGLVQETKCFLNMFWVDLYKHT